MSNLKDKSKKELNDLAKKAGLKNYSKFSKDELVKAISDAETSAKTETVDAEDNTEEVSGERVTNHDLQDIQDAKSDMIDESGDELSDSLQPGNFEEESPIATEKSEKHKKFLDEQVFSEGYKEKSSFDIM